METGAHRVRQGDPLGEEELYRLLSDNPRDVVYRTDVLGRTQWISPSISHLLGWSAEELVGTPIESLVHPDDWEVHEPARQALRAGQPVPEAAQGTSLMRIRTKSGGYKWTASIGVPILDEQGGPAGVVVRMRDVDDTVTARERSETDRQRLQATFDSLIDPLVLLAPVHDANGAIVDFTCTEANPAACAYAGLSREQLEGTSLLALMPGHGLDGRLELLISAMETGEPLVLDDFPYELELKDGRLLYFDLRITRAGDHLIYTFRDQTERRRAAAALADREELYRLVTEDVTDAVVRIDDDAIITWVSPSFERLTGFPSGSVIGRSGLEFLAPEEVPAARENLTRRLAGDLGGDRTPFHLVRADGSQRWVTTHTRPFVHADRTPEGFVTVLRDVDDQIQAQLKHDHEIGHDTLTGLADRELAIARIGRALDDLAPSGRSVALLCIGVDRMTTVNQALSYAAGDRVLLAVAERITAAVGDPDRIARVAGDEFMVLIPDLVSVSDAASQATLLVAAAHGTVTIDEQSIEPTVSIGIATGHRGSTSEELLRQASLAVRQAKDAGRDRWQFIDPALASEAQQRLTAEAELRDVLREGQLTAWYQPVVTLADRRLRGYEALARWTRADGSVAQPEQFLAVAEASGLVVDVDLAVLRSALDLLAVSPIEHIAVNVSPPSLGTAEYPARFRTLLDASGIDPMRLRLEVTETALLDVGPAIAEAMRLMADTGATWFVDDFCTGYSSISHLRDLPVAGLKLDQSFTAGIREGDPTCIKLAQGLIGLADGLGLDTVAEGVESEFEAGALLGQGWRQGQGWLFGRPQAAPLDAG